MSKQTRRAIYGKLAGDTTLNAMLGAPADGYSKAIYHQQAPNDAAFPFVILQKVSGVPTEAFGDPSALENEVWLVKAVDRSTSADTADDVSARIAVLLNDAALSVSGTSLLYLRRQADVDYPEEIDGVMYVHAGSQFRLVTSD